MVVFDGFGTCGKPPLGGGGGGALGTFSSGRKPPARKLFYLSLSGKIFKSGSPFRLLGVPSPNFSEFGRKKGSATLMG
jgi:hypothetical protein